MVLIRLRPKRAEEMRVCPWRWRRRGEIVRELWLLDPSQFVGGSDLVSPKFTSHVVFELKLHALWL